MFFIFLNAILFSYKKIIFLTQNNYNKNTIFTTFVSKII